MPNPVPIIFESSCPSQIFQFIVSSIPIKMGSMMFLRWRRANKNHANKPVNSHLEQPLPVTKIHCKITVPIIIAWCQNLFIDLVVRKARNTSHIPLVAYFIGPSRDGFPYFFHRKNITQLMTIGTYFLTCLLIWHTSWASDFPTKYDAQIKGAVAKWWLDLPDWQLLKAQYWQESHLDPNARSNVGAEGIAQFMPLSWQDQIKALGWPVGVSRRDANLAIEGGAYYMRGLRRTWRRDRTPIEAHDLALGSYNAGTGSILKAQKACAGAHLWPDIAPCLESITGTDFARQTRDYVVKIHRWRMEMEK